jgi:short-subunit dehydrogenase
MPNIALVTGASSGLGEEFARLHAEKGGDVILVARREDQLNALKTELESKHGIAAHVMAMDLGQPDAADRLHRQVTAAGLEVDVLINNAGFGGHGRFVERDLARDLAMIDVNVKALVGLCHRFGADMAERGKGRILNVGSTAGFMPGPLQATYFATKAFVSSFSQALDHELRPRGVTVTVLAPGYVRTEFAETADLHGTDLVNQKGASARSAAKHGYDAMRDGRLVTVNEGLLGFLVNWVIPLMPRRQALKMVEKMQSK